MQSGLDNLRTCLICPLDLFKNKLYFRTILSLLQKIYEDSAESSHIFHIQFPLLLITYISIVDTIICEPKLIHC